MTPTMLKPLLAGATLAGTAGSNLLKMIADREAGKPGLRRPAVNPNQLVNPYYMRQPDTDSFAPMLAYQEYMRTGQMPQQGPSQFTPMPQSQQPQQQAPNVLSNPFGPTPPAMSSGGGGK